MTAAAPAPVQYSPRDRLDELPMSIDTQPAWLSEETYDLARIELALLRMERATGSHRGRPDPERRARRIRQLHELIATAAVGHKPPDDPYRRHRHSRTA